MKSFGPVLGALKVPRAPNGPEHTLDRAECRLARTECKLVRTECKLSRQDRAGGTSSTLQLIQSQLSLPFSAAVRVLSLP